LNDAQWRELQECASRLDVALKSGPEQLDLRQFLPSPDAPHRRAVLLELIKTELEARYRRGQSCRLEDFVRRYPELGGPDALPDSLVYEEFRMRRLHGERPELDEYRSRFPGQFKGLCRLSELDRSIGIAAEREHEPSRVGAPSDPSAPSLRELSGYEKLELIGHGAFGEVWKALAPGGVEVALKVVMLNLDHEATRRELKALDKIRRLRHPFLLQTHSFGMIDGKLTVVMELADESLNDRFKKNKDKWSSAEPGDELVNYIAQAAEALDYLQSQQVSHRDIKPQNILILRGFAKVADFGFLRGQGQGLEEASLVCGTPVYMAPEVWAQQVSRHSDQYSLAATYVHMRLAHPVFEGSFHEIFMHHINSAPNLDALPAGEQTVLKRALAKKPDDRFPSCAAFAEALREAAGVKRPVPVPAAPRPRWQWLTVGVAVIAVLSLLAVLLADKFKKAPGPTADWVPPGWVREDGTELVQDSNGRKFYQRIWRDVGGQRVTMVAVPRDGPNDPATFYMMDNKVWNDLYRVFDEDERSKALKQKYAPPGSNLELVPKEPQWKRGAYVIDPNAPGRGPDAPPFFGVDGPKGRLLVFRVTVTEAHCFAEWLGGRLPSREQWRKAAGDGDPDRVGPFAGPRDKTGFAVGLMETGPWPVDQGDRDVSIHGVRQMAANGREWTRDLNDGTTIPLTTVIVREPRAHTMGRSYESGSPPLTFKEMSIEYAVPVTKPDHTVSFRVVLEAE
jgi:serine/threonine protein kinase/formylglycine-generating enzyme required for sulfatase activity